jgi:hypothetical protein
MADPILVDFIELHARGITDIDAELKKLKQSMGDAESAHAALLKSLNDPAYEKKARELMALKGHEADLARLEKTRIANQSRMAELQGRMRDVQSGQFAKQLSTGAGLARLEASVRDAERKAELRYKYGRSLGSVIGFGQDAMQSRAAGAAAAVGTTAFGAAMAGFSGTVEMNRFTTEITLVSREMASALKPALEFVTAGMSKLRRGMEQLDSSGQNAVAALALLGATKFAAGRLGAVGSFLSGGSAAAAAGVATAAGSGASGAAIAGTGAAGAAGLAGAKGRGGWAGQTMKSLGVWGAALASVATSLSSPEGGAGMFEDVGFGKKTSNWAATFISAAGGIGTINDAFHGRRPAPARMLGLAADAVGMEGVGRFLGGERHAPYGYGEDGKPLDASGMAKKDKDRRDVVLADAGFGGVGSSYERIADRAALEYTGENEGGVGALTGAIERLIAAINEAARREERTGTEGDRGAIIARLRGRS